MAPDRRLEGKLPATAAGLIYAARMLVRLETDGLSAPSKNAADEFPGCLIWVTGHHEWSASTRNVGAYIFARLGVDGDAIALDAMPARLFESGEAIAAEATLLQPLLFQWETYVVTASGNYIARIGYDGLIRGITARGPEMLGRIKGMFAELGLREGILPQSLHQRG
jgi:hypothetical protein